MSHSQGGEQSSWEMVCPCSPQSALGPPGAFCLVLLSNKSMRLPWHPFSHLELLGTFSSHLSPTSFTGPKLFSESCSNFSFSTQPSLVWFLGKLVPVSLGLSPSSFLYPAISSSWPQLALCQGLSVLASAGWVSVAQAGLAQLPAQGWGEVGGRCRRWLCWG